MAFHKARGPDGQHPFLIEKKHVQVADCLELLRFIGAPPQVDIDTTLDPASSIIKDQSEAASNDNEFDAQRTRAKEVVALIKVAI